MRGSRDERVKAGGKIESTGGGVGKERGREASINLKKQENRRERDKANQNNECHACGNFFVHKKDRENGPLLSFERSEQLPTVAC
jgi:hypothetical protein